jgi:hypothetical protein
MGEAAVPASLMASSVLGGIFAPEGQNLSSFESRGQPLALAHDLRKGLGDYLQLAIEEAGKDVTVDTTVAPLPSFTGGGLPFPIGAPALDPTRRNPERRTLGAPEFPEGFMSLLTERQTGGGEGPPDDYPPDDYPPDDDEGDPRFRADPEVRARGERDEDFSIDRPPSGFGPTPSTPAGVWPDSGMSDPNWASVTEAQGDGDVTDLDQAQGAIELLMQQLRPRA